MITRVIDLPPTLFHDMRHSGFSLVDVYDHWWCQIRLPSPICWLYLHLSRKFFILNIPIEWFILLNSSQIGSVARLMFSFWWKRNEHDQHVVVFKMIPHHQFVNHHHHRCLLDIAGLSLHARVIQLLLSSLLYWPLSQQPSGHLGDTQLDCNRGNKIIKRTATTC